MMTMNKENVMDNSQQLQVNIRPRGCRLEVLELSGYRKCRVSVHCLVSRH